MNARNLIKKYLRIYNIQKLTKKEDKEVRLYFRSKGYKLKHTDWHAFYKGRSGHLQMEYIPRGFFKTKISPVLNQKVQWPALLDKNLYYRIFKEFEQPRRVVQNMNGFYFIDDKLVSHEESIKAVSQIRNLLIIKPSLESGAGKNVLCFKNKGVITTHKDLSIKELLKQYKKDFIIQEFVDQSYEIGLLNSKSLNTLRIVSYLNNNGTHILSSNIKIGSPESYTDNYANGGIMCGIDDNGKLKSRGFNNRGQVVYMTNSGITLHNYQIPNFEKVIKMVKSMHKRVPYFRLISWDIAINHKNLPVLIEYNTYNQGFLQQMCNGPIFGKYFDEILELGIKD